MRFIGGLLLIALIVIGAGIATGFIDLQRTQEGRLPEVYEILKKGSEIAAETAQGTLDRVRHAMKIDYFTDNGLLK